MGAPVLVVHRRNRIDQLAILPKGCWIEIDLDIYSGRIYLNHDPLTQAPESLSPEPDLFDAFLPRALEAGVAGFVLDCKRENVEKLARPLLEKHGVSDYFYLNEMEVQADIFISQNAAHRTGVRVWKYRGASDVLRYAADMKAMGQCPPAWVWVDCWQQGLLQDTQNAHLPVNGEDASRLQKLGVRLCVCSPELYVHSYVRDYDVKELELMQAGVAAYRTRLAGEGINPDAICTKFPRWWGL